ncbi:MAG: hypothetical protein DRI90_01515, partial [Deltaproteobacteria bacterium]
MINESHTHPLSYDEGRAARGISGSPREATMDKLASYLLTLALTLTLVGCTQNDETEPGPSGGGGTGGEGGSAIECSDQDSFDPGDCPTSYPDSDCVVYVDAETEASGEGSSWQDAFRTVQEGIDLAHCASLNAGTCEQWQVWVRAGSYFIQQGCRTHSVRLRANTEVYGGFAGTETTLEDRDWESHETILDGRDGPESENHVYHVVHGATDARLDGFTVSGGRADQENHPNHSDGGGMVNLAASPAVHHCTFRDNTAALRGGGMNNLATASPTVVGCKFIDNHAGENGGGMANTAGSSPVITDCLFEENTAVEYGGGI